MTTAATARRRRIPLWLLLCISCIGIPLLTILLFLVWLCSSSDLTAVIAEAKRQGIPTTWQEQGRTGANADHLGRFLRLQQASTKLKSWVSKDPKHRLVVGEPAPECLAHWAVQDPQAVAELDQAILDLINPGCPLYDSQDFRPGRIPSTVTRAAHTILRERIHVADREALARLCDLNLRLCEAAPPPMMIIDRLVHASLLGLAASTVARRHRDLGHPDRAAFADRLDLLLQATVTPAVSTDISTFISWLDEVRKMDTNPFAAKWDDLDTWKRCVGMRSTRKRELLMQLTWIQTINAAGPMPIEERWRLAKDMSQQAQLRPPLWGDDIGLHDGRSRVEETAVRTCLMLELLIAELRQQPWPRDRMDPQRAPLRPLVRNGVVVGGYSVGNDGVDDGGDKDKDRHILVFASLKEAGSP